MENKGNLDKISSQDLSPETQKLINDNWDYLINDDVEKIADYLLPYQVGVSRDDQIQIWMDGYKIAKEMYKYTEDEVRELIIKALTHNDHNLCGSLVTKDGDIRTANFNVWFEELKKK